MEGSDWIAYGPGAVRRVAGSFSLGPLSELLKNRKSPLGHRPRAVFTCHATPGR